MSQLHPSRIDVAEDDRAALCELFSVSYAAMSDLRSQVVQARVSVRGSGSHGLNLLCDTVRDGVVEVADGLLARCVVLGGQPRTTIRAMSSATTLPEYDVEGTEAREHLEELADRLARRRALRHAPGGRAVEAISASSPPPARASSRDGPPRARRPRGGSEGSAASNKRSPGRLGDALSSWRRVRRCRA